MWNVSLRVLRWIERAITWGPLIWWLVGATVLTALGFAIEVARRVPPEEIFQMTVGVFGMMSVASYALWCLWREFGRWLGQRHLSRLVAEVEGIPRIADFPSRVRAIDEWRNRVGLLPSRIHNVVLDHVGDNGDLITVPAQRLRAILANIDNWF